MSYHVSTHSRPKAAGFSVVFIGLPYRVSTHSRPKAAGRLEYQAVRRLPVSTHSRPKAAGCRKTAFVIHLRFQHTAARRRLVSYAAFCLPENVFQHTAARRRLGELYQPQRQRGVGFNTQPPEGGWLTYSFLIVRLVKFQHTAARRRLASSISCTGNSSTVSTHSRPKAAGPQPIFGLEYE